MFDQAKADEICRHIAGGLSMRKAAAKAAVDRSTVYEWLAETTSFADQYARADKVRALFHGDDIEDVLDDVREGKLPPDVARVIVDGKKWVASKLHAKRYGDRIQADVDARLEITLVDATKRED
jgi:transposase